MGGNQSREHPPDKMKRLVLTKSARDPNGIELAVEEVDVPKPADGEVLVKVRLC